MKITPADFDHLQSHLAALDTPEQRFAYKERGLSTTRYQWDLVGKALLTAWISRHLYLYLNDTHIQTALNKIIKPL